MFSELRLGDLKVVFEEVYDVSAKWYELGITLEIRISLLNTIQKQFSDPQSCLLEVITMWLKSSNSSTWGTLIDALKTSVVGEHRLAEELRMKYIPTSTEGNNHLLEIMMVTVLHLYFVQQDYNDNLHPLNKFTFL